MGGIVDSLFGGKPKEVKAPPVPPPPPVPVVQDEAAEFEVKEQVRRSGFQQTFLTGALTPKSTGRKKFLG